MARQQKAQLEKSSVEKMLTIIALFFLFLNLWLVVFNLQDLPEKVPVDFGTDGAPTNFISKNIIWLLPTIGIIAIPLLLQFAKKPVRHNTTTSMSQVNATMYQRRVRLVVYLLTMLISVILCYFSWKSIEIGLNQSNNADPWFLPLLLFLVLGGLFLGLIPREKDFRKKPST